MYLIVGLGNPEKEYSNTRHNMGFNVINKIAKDCDIKISQSKFKNFYKIPSENIIVVYDDIDLEPGTIRIRKKGGPGTHNGMKSVVHFLQTEDFTRIRVGIGAPVYKDTMIDYVIGPIPEEEKPILEEGVNKAAEAVLDILKNGIDKAMNVYNAK